MVLCCSLTLICIALSLIPDRYLTRFRDLQRHSPLDGLRGILATTVVSYHFYLNYFFGKTGRWGDTSDRLILNLGAVPVSLFFMITGFLFFNKILKPDQISVIAWRTLFISRFRRILPLYYCLGIITVLLFAIDQPVQFQKMGGADWGKWVYSWLLFIDLHLPHFPSWNLIAGASWTLIFEWGFYFALPALYWLIHSTNFRQPVTLTTTTLRQKLVLLVSFALFVQIFSRTWWEFYLLFVLALFTSGQRDFGKIIAQRFPNALSLLVIGLIGYSLFYTDSYTLLQKCLLAMAFFLLANGVSVFGILNNKGLKILGELSYSIYLMHGIVIYLAFYWLKIFDFKQPIMDYYWLFPLVLSAVILLAVVTYFCIERPFLTTKSNPK